MKKLQVGITLKEELQQLVEIDGEVNISAIGYDYLNKVAEISLLAPDTQNFNDKEVSNPYIIYSENGNIDRALYKCIAYGMGPMGNRVITSATVEFNPDVQLVKDLTYVVCNDAEAGRITKEHLLTEEEKRVGYTVPLKDDLIIYCNLSNADINQAFNIYSNNKAYAERIAQTLAKRNALKCHPALSNLITRVDGVKGSRVAKVNLIKIYDDFDKDKIFNYLKTQDIEVLKEEYIEIGTQVYSYSQVQNNEINTENEIDKSKVILLEILENLDRKDVMSAIRKLNLYEKNKRISEFPLKQLEMIVATVGV